MEVSRKRRRTQVLVGASPEAHKIGIANRASIRMLGQNGGRGDLLFVGSGQHPVVDLQTSQWIFSRPKVQAWKFRQANEYITMVIEISHQPTVVPGLRLVKMNSASATKLQGRQGKVAFAFTADDCEVG